MFRSIVTNGNPNRTRVPTKLTPELIGSGHSIHADSFRNRTEHLRFLRSDDARNLILSAGVPFAQKLNSCFVHVLHSSLRGTDSETKPARDAARKKPKREENFLLLNGEATESN